MTLLPPRHTAQAPQDASARKPSKPANSPRGISFGHKLEKAKTLKLVTAPQKQPLPAPAKPVLRSTAEKTTKSVKEQSPQTKGLKVIPKSIAKTGKPVHEDPAVDESDEEHDAPEAPPVEVSQPVARKSAKPLKSDAGQSRDGVKAQVQATSPTNVVAPISGLSDQPSDDQGGADGSGDESGDPFTGKATAEFGTGKIAAAAGKDAPAATATREAASDQIDAEAAAAAVDPLAQLAAPAENATKAASHAEAPIEPAVPGVAGLTLNSPSTSPANITGKLPVAVTTPQARFVEQNHPGIITGITGQLLPRGGSMQLRLDPPELGALSVTVHLRDGVMTASFETSNDDATKLLSHSLGQLKSGLEAAGVSVDKIHVEQAPKRDMQGDSGGDSQQPPSDQQRQAQQDQQRREMIRQMWKKLAGGDPLDLVA